MPGRYDDERDHTRELPAYLDPRRPPEDTDAYEAAEQASYRDSVYHRGYDDRGYRGYQGYDDRGYGAPPPPPPRRTAPLPGPPAPPPPRRKKKRRPLRIIAWLLVALLVAIVGFAVYLDLNLNREDVLADYEGRPGDTPGTTWLLVGSDSRDDLTEEERNDLATGYAEGKRTDTIMLLHVPDSDAPPTLVSLPRDTLSDVPGNGQQKLNAAFSLGGGQLLVQTVEGLTGLRIDRYAEIGFGGFAGVVDAIGGVDMCLDEPMQDPKAGLDLPAGCQTLNGAQALGYVRTRASAMADLDRVQRQREFLGALLNKATSFGTLVNPFNSIPLALKSTGSLIVDDGAHLWHLAGMGLAMASADLVTTTVPIAGTPEVSGLGSVVQWDDELAAQMFGALAEDKAVPAELLSG